MSEQKGVFRVNCIDCLDRTNVVEGLLAKRSLKQQLVRLGVLMPSDRIEAQTTFDYVFRNGMLTGYHTPVDVLLLLIHQQIWK